MALETDFDDRLLVLNGSVRLLAAQYSMIGGKVRDCYFDLMGCSWGCFLLCGGGNWFGVG